MSTSSSDAWITDLGAALAAVSNPTQPSSSGGSTATNPFVSVGRTLVSPPPGQTGRDIDGEYDGGAKRAHLFLFDDKAQQARPLCLGFVGLGQDNKRFCLRPATVQDASGRWFCGVQRHLTPFVPIHGTFYPRANEIIAFCSPCFPLEVVPLGDLDILKNSRQTIQEWATILKGFLVKDVNQDPPVNSLRQMGFGTVVPLKTPSRSLGPLEGLDRFPYYTPEDIRSLLIAQDKDEEDWDDMLATQSLPRDVVGLLKAMKDFMIDFENWWKRPFTDSNIVLSSAHGDLHTIKQTCESLSLMLGNPVDIGDMSFPDAWTAISYAATYFTSSPELDLINTKLIQSQEVLQSTQHMQVEIAKINQSINKFDQRFTAIHPLFQAIQNIQASITALQQARPTVTPFQQFNSAPQLMPITPTNSSDSEPSFRLSTLEEKIRQLENRVVGDGVTIGTFIFQTLDDVRSWCALHLKSNIFGLFLDGVSIFEFLAQDHADAT
jgi:hypothetical protein